MFVNSIVADIETSKLNIEMHGLKSSMMLTIRAGFRLKHAIEAYY